ncbi:hypothetical protein DFH09DRAFT_1334783 [Mycena vulgaris]|nr:hypothetical protein DFH09DRAFT_1334783 [Mycena vulgaris]
MATTALASSTLLNRKSGLASSFYKISKLSTTTSGDSHTPNSIDAFCRPTATTAANLSVRPLHPKWRVDALALMRMDEEEISAESDSFVVYLLLTYLSFTYSENIYIFISSSALLHATALPLSAPSFLIHHANPLARALIPIHSLSSL